jgi:hypothetical protein
MRADRIPTGTFRRFFFCRVARRHSFVHTGPNEHPENRELHAPSMTSGLWPPRTRTRGSKKPVADHGSCVWTPLSINRYINSCVGNTYM